MAAAEYTLELEAAPVQRVCERIAALVDGVPSAKRRAARRMLEIAFSDPSALFTLMQRGQRLTLKPTATLRLLEEALHALTYGEPARNHAARRRR